MRERIGIKTLSLALVLTCALMACGNEAPNAPADRDEVQLIDPVGVSASFDTAALRNLYNSQIFSASVCPYVEEYSFEDDQTFLRYGALPGQQVAKGTGLLYANTKSLDKQIEDMEKSIKEQEESYQEAIEELKEALLEPKRRADDNLSIVENLEEIEPEQYIWTTVSGTEGPVKVENPEYIAWQNDFKRYDGAYRSASLQVDMLEEDIRQRTELYELDHNYNLSRLSYLKSRRKKCILTAGMKGVVASIAFFGEGNRLSADTSLIAVGDMDRKRIRSEFINSSVIKSAKEIYAVIDGVRYEIEYEPMNSTEYSFLSKRDGDVYTTFYFKDDADEVEIGSYAVIVIVRDFREQVLTIPASALSSDSGSYYVYVEGENGERIYTPVRTGMRDGTYVEILSGLSEGDRVLADGMVAAGSDTAMVERGSIAYDFKGTGYFFYPSVTIVENPVEYGTCYMVEIHVAMYQQVKKGDLLATVRVVADDVALKRYETDLKRERERLNDLIEEDEEKNKKAIAARRKTIAQLEEKIAKMKADFAVTQIRAPLNGIVTWVENLEEEQLLYSGAEMFEISSESQSYIIVEDAGHVLNYGNEVSITYTNQGSEKRTATGTVVTLQPMAVSGALRNDWALISVSAETLGDMTSSFISSGGWWNRSQFEVTVKARSMENVLLVPRRAVTTKNNQTYVKVRMEDGRVVEQSFIAGGSDLNNYWVIEGLTEGMTVCLE